MPIDFTDAPEQRGFEPIPEKTIVPLTMHIRPGNAGEGGMLKRSSKGDCEMLDCEFIVVEGEYKNRRFWHNLIMGGTTAGHEQAREISLGLLKAIVDCAKGLDPKDDSAAARAARTLEYKDFDGMNFRARLGIEKGGPKFVNGQPTGENYPDRNYILEVITKGRKDWQPVEQQPPFNGGGKGAGDGAAAAAPVERPEWA